MGRLVRRSLPESLLGASPRRLPALVPPLRPTRGLLVVPSAALLTPTQTTHSLRRHESA